MVYRYQRVEPEGPAPLGAGNFIYLRASGRHPGVVYAGEAERLAEALGVRWREAVERHGATDIYARKNVAFRIRQDELTDLLAAYSPVMNGGPDTDAKPEPAPAPASPESPEAGEAVEAAAPAKSRRKPKA